MIQKDDRKYTIVVSHSNPNIIRVRRIRFSKLLTHTCLGLALFTVSGAAYGLTNLKLPLPNAGFFQASLMTGDFSGKISPAQIYGEGGPDSEDIYELKNEAENINRSVKTAAVIDGETIPSIYPLTGKINDDFGSRRNPFGGYTSEFHPGLDIDGEKGDAVIASANGIVLKAGWQGGYGNMIEIDHGSGLTTRYGHLSQIEVQLNQEIKRGQEIGKVGSTGRSTGPHLHYEIRIDNEAVNPHAYLPQDVIVEAQR